MPQDWHDLKVGMGQKAVLPEPLGLVEVTCHYVNKLSPSFSGIRWQLLLLMTSKIKTKTKQLIGRVTKGKGTREIFLLTFCFPDGGTAMSKAGAQSPSRSPAWVTAAQAFGPALLLAQAHQEAGSQVEQEGLVLHAVA